MNAIMLALLVASAAPPDSLDSVRKEPDLVRRGERALALADTLCASARQIVRDSGSRTQLFDMLERTVEAAELSLSSLKETGRKPSKLSKQYKRGELRTRDIVRQMNDISAALSIDDRPAAEKLRDRVSIVHEEFLLGIMGGK
jgi:hypothetical protein